MKKLKHGIAQITDVTVAYGIAVSIVATLLVPMWQWGAEEYRMSVVAGQANTVQKAVNKYIADMQSTIAAGSTATSGFTLTVPMLVSAGYLPAGFSSTNYYTSTYQTLIFQPVANKFHSMTFLSGGSQLSLSEARKIANHIGVSGGYIENGVAKGALGSWQENLSSFGGFNPGDAHVVIAGFYSNGALVNDYLYRHSVAGHPELNTMGTALNMGGNDVSAAKTVSAVNVSASEGVQSSGWITANGNITAGKDVQIGGVIKPMQVNNAGTYCDTWGAISRNAIGALLSCQSGVWKSSSSNTNYISGICAPGEGQTLSCYLADLTWTCFLTGVMNTARSETGIIQRDSNGWYLTVYRNDSPGRYAWGCIK